MLLAKICLSCMPSITIVSSAVYFHSNYCTFDYITMSHPLLHLMNPLDDQELEELHYESWYKDREMDFTQVCVKRPMQLLHGCVCLCVVVLGENGSVVCAGCGVCNTLRWR